MWRGDEELEKEVWMESNIFCSLKYGVNLARRSKACKAMKEGTREKGIRRHARRKKMRGKACEKKNIMVIQDKTRHKSKRAKEIGSKAVPRISCRAVVALTVG